jgi:hypothetical protein
MPVVAIPAPVGGWNASNALDKMPATDAVSMVNMIPRTGFVQSRRGYVQHCTGLGGPVETLSSWRGAAGDALIAGANGNLWNVSTSTPSSLGSGFANNRWQVFNHSGLLILCNGASTPQVFNGTSITALSATGPTLTTLWAGNGFKGRAFYWAQNA